MALFYSLSEFQQSTVDNFCLIIFLARAKSVSGRTSSMHFFAGSFLKGPERGV